MADDLLARLNRLAPTVDTTAGLTYVHQTTVSARDRQRHLTAAAALVLALLIASGALVLRPHLPTFISFADSTPVPTAPAASTPTSIPPIGQVPLPRPTTTEPPTTTTSTSTTTTTIVRSRGPSSGNGSTSGGGATPTNPPSAPTTQPPSGRVR